MVIGEWFMAKKRKKQFSQYSETEGIFTAAPSGFGFVDRKGGETVFIPPGKVRNAITGDRVAVLITDPAGHRNLGPVGEISRIISRGKQFVVGELLPGRMLNPLDEHFNGKVKITGSFFGVSGNGYLIIYGISFA